MATEFDLSQPPSLCLGINGYSISKNNGIWFGHWSKKSDDLFENLGIKIIHQNIPYSPFALFNFVTQADEDAAITHFGYYGTGVLSVFQ